MVFSEESKIHVKERRTFFYEFFTWSACIEKNKFLQKIMEVIAWDKKTADIDIPPLKKHGPTTPRLQPIIKNPSAS